MHEYCHRCGGELSASDGVSPFCPHCGSPQIYLQDYEEQTGGADSTGAPPPAETAAGRVEDCDSVCAAGGRCSGGVLSLVSARVQLVSPLSWLWTISGSIITLALYQRRRHWRGWMPGLGRGSVSWWAWPWLFSLRSRARELAWWRGTGLHSMAGFDADLTQMLHAQIEKAATTAPESPEALRFLYSPEVKAGLMLAGFGMVSGILLVLSTVGGALGGFLRMRRKVSA